MFACLLPAASPSRFFTLATPHDRWMWRAVGGPKRVPARQPLPTAGSRPPLPPSIQAPWGPTERRMANKPCPPVRHCLRGGRLGALGCEYRVLHWSAHYGSVGTVLQGIQCVAEELIMEGCLRAFAPRGTEPGEEMARGGLPD